MNTTQYKREVRKTKMPLYSDLCFSFPSQICYQACYKKENEGHNSQIYYKWNIKDDIIGDSFEHAYILLF